jgi:transglutaminase-like putative cysteine protease
MRSRVLVLGAVWSLGLALLLGSSGVLRSSPKAPDTKAGSGKPDIERTFQFTYRAEINDLPQQSKRVQIWIPLAASDTNQKVTVKRVESVVLTRMTREPAYGNRMLYAEIDGPKQSSFVVSVEYQVTRKQYSKGDYSSLMQYNGLPSHFSADTERLLRPDRLVPIDGMMKQIADEVTRDQQGDVQKAHALYEYVFKNLRYDKSGTGWGRGDSLWACDAKRGNCTDFHSLFISLARAELIPARFEIGFPLPETVHDGTIPGYHCWAEFYVDGAGWVPVDISEARKDPSKHDYFFGTLDANRIQFSQGRDLQLSPKQSGAPLNYFIYPYVEVDGSPYEKLDKKFTFREGQQAMATGR